MKVSHKTIRACLLLGLIIAGILPRVNAQATFTDVTDSAGIDHVFRVYEGTFGGGVVVFDYDRDGFEDLFITGGTGPDVLYRNRGDGTFENRYTGSGLETTSAYITQGAASADVDRDGYRDLYVTTINTADGSSPIPRAKNLLFLNKGDGTFRDATDAYGLADMISFSTGAAFGDVNADGYPDLFVGNYFRNFTGKLGVIKDATIVSSNEMAESYLLLNRGGTKFELANDSWGVTHKGFGFGGVFTDFDNDQDQDLLVNQDFGYKAVPNFLYENQHPESRFRDVSKASGMDLPINAMGAAVGDLDNDGWMDYYVTNIKFNRLMVRQGADGSYRDEAKARGAYSFAISWGANFADFDSDGDLDLFVANGDLNPNCVPMRNFYFENEAGTFSDKSRVSGLNDPGMGRGSAVFDLENDGDLDLVVVNQEPILEYPVPSRTRLLRNDSPSGNWLQVALEGVYSDPQGIGSRIRVVAGGRSMIREVDGGNASHLSQSSTRQHFGLGNADRVDSVVVLWSGGQKQVLTDIGANQLLNITEAEPPVRPNRVPWALLGFIAIAGGGIWWFFKSRKAQPAG